MALTLAGCSKQEVTTYKIPKDSTSEHSTAANNAGSAVDPHAGMMMSMPAVKVAQLPEGWAENPNPGAMRAASYIVSNGEGNEAEVAVIPMGGMQNVELQLVNMWREQLKLAALSEDDMGGQSVAVPIANGQGKLFELASEEAVLGGQHKARILVAMLKDDQLTWFFKFAGEDELVGANKQKFLDFLKAVTFEAPSAMPAGHPPMAGGTGMGTGQGMMGSGGATIPPGAGDHPQWEVPASWTEVAHSPFLVAKFQVSSEGGGKADVNVSRSGGAGGGLLPNVNRWRGQLSLPPMDQAALDKVVTSMDLPAGAATLVDFSGESAEDSIKVRCIGIMLSREGETWFYKLMGDESVVAREREALLEFVRSVKY